jgi:hypothetical protein
MQLAADVVELVLGPRAGYQAQRGAELRPQPGLHDGKVSCSHDQHRLVATRMEQGDRDGRAGVSQVPES